MKLTEMVISTTKNKLFYIYDIMSPHKIGHIPSHYSLEIKINQII